MLRLRPTGKLTGRRSTNYHRRRHTPLSTLKVNYKGEIPKKTTHEPPRLKRGTSMKPPLRAPESPSLSVPHSEERVSVCRVAPLFTSEGNFHNLTKEKNTNLLHHLSKMRSCVNSLPTRAGKTGKSLLGEGKQEHHDSVPRFLAKCWS